MTRYAGVPEGWEYVDNTYGSHSIMGLNKLASTMEMMDWEAMEKEMNKRMNIVGSNGNDGHHYWEDSWNEEYED